MLCLGTADVHAVPVVPGAVNAAVHDRLDQGADILVLHRPLALHEARPVGAEDHGLVLQVALAALVADWAIKWVVNLRKRGAGHRQHVSDDPRGTLSVRKHTQFAWRGSHLTSKNSMTPSRAFFTMGVSVLIFMPGIAGMAHDAAGLGGPFSIYKHGHKRSFDFHYNCSGAAAAWQKQTSRCSTSLAYLHKTHAAVSSDRQALMIAKPANQRGTRIM
eukprot:361603-Chlamydomonas_euryale.AAC.21